jgi:hypothetical protein
MADEYAKIKQRCAEDPEYRKKYLAMRAGANKRARERKAAAKTPEQRAEEERRRIEAVRAANARRAGKPPPPPMDPNPAPRHDLPSWKKGKPGRLVAMCGWNGWG